MKPTDNEQILDFPLFNLDQLALLSDLPIYWGTVAGILIRKIKEWALDALKNNGGSLGEIETANMSASKKAVTILAELGERAERARNANSMAEFQKAKLLAEAWYTFILAANPDFKNLLEDEVSAKAIYGALLMGMCYGSYEAGNPDEMPPVYGPYFSSREGAKHRGKGWAGPKAKKQGTMEKIKVYAQKRYEGGYRKPHHDLAKAIMNSQEFEGLVSENGGPGLVSRRDVLKLVGEVAEKYDCKSGGPKHKTT